MGQAADPMNRKKLADALRAESAAKQAKLVDKEPVDKEAVKLREDIAQTRASMSGTIEELHGKLNPTVLKEQVLEQFHDASDKIKAELLEAKEAVKQEVKAELQEAK